MQILNMLGAPYETVNVLEDDSLRMGMKEFSQWPTFPQVYIDGEFYGGCDILIGGHTSSLSLLLHSMYMRAANVGRACRGFPKRRAARTNGSPAELVREICKAERVY